jgi:hypothetical protein
VNIATAKQWPKHEGSAFLPVIHLPLSLHDPQPRLNGFVIGRWIFFGSPHHIVDCPLSNSPQDLQQAKFARRRERCLFALPIFPHG